MLRKEYDNYIFDLYGTLVDIHTEEGDSLVWEKLALFYGYYDANYAPKELQERYRALISGRENEMKACLQENSILNPHLQKEDRKLWNPGMGKQDDVHEAHPEVKLEEIFRQLFVEKGVQADMTLAIHAGQFFRILSTEYVRIYEGAMELLESLKKEGKKVYLLSNAQRIFTEYEMHTLGIAKYFDDILISSDYGVKKPDIRFFEQLLEKHQIDVTRSIMIGNDLNSDIAGAKQVGLDTFYIHSNISPELPWEEIISKTSGQSRMRKIKPDADYVLMEMDLKKVKEMLHIHL